MAIDLALVKMAELKAAIKGLNASGLLETPIKMVGKAPDLAQKFVDGLAECDKAGKLDSVPDPVFDYYNKIVPPPASKTLAPDDAAGAQTEETVSGAQAPAKGRGRGAAKKTTTAAAPKEKRATRASVFAKVLKRGKFTKDQLVEKLTTEYGSNEKENKWWVGQYVALVVELGVVQVDENQRIIFVA